MLFWWSCPDLFSLVFGEEVTKPNLVCFLFGFSFSDLGVAFLQNWTFELNQAEPQLTFAGLRMLLPQCRTCERSRTKWAFERGSNAPNQKQTNKIVIPPDYLGIFLTILPMFQLGNMNMFATFEDLEWKQAFVLVDEMKSAFWHSWVELWEAAPNTQTSWAPGHWLCNWLLLLSDCHCEL